MERLFAIAPALGARAHGGFHAWWLILLVVVFIAVLPLARFMAGNGHNRRDERPPPRPPLDIVRP